MKWRDRKQSTNVDDRRNHSGGASSGGPSMGTVLYLWPLIKPLLRSKLGMAIVVVAAIAYFGNFISLSSLTGEGPARAPDNQQQDDESAAFIKTVLADTEAVWTDLYAQAGAKYPAPTLVLYRNSTRSGCGSASSGMGPFYCPTDQKVYVDLSFFDELKRSYSAGGDFAEAYVLAHEVGHHIQNLEGTLSEVQRAKQQVRGKGEQNALQVRVELQADCFAGLWAYQAQQDFDMLEQGDLEEALTTAAAIGDDRLQKQSRGFSIPHTFTHGSSKQRVKWFSRGFKRGKIADCDTFE
jgi:predicted metalloprotease